MNRTLIVIDMQNDFVTGSLGTKEAKGIIKNVETKIKEYLLRKDNVIFTRDTHNKKYLKTLEGVKLPIQHCIEGTDGWEIIDELKPYAEYCKIIDKNSFGYNDWSNEVKVRNANEIELVGVCTDICVISNALTLKSFNTEAEIIVDASCCAGSTPESHRNALEAMKQCHINIINE